MRDDTQKPSQPLGFVLRSEKAAMNLWYLFGGLFLLILAAPHLVRAGEALPKIAQNAVALVLFFPVLILMGWAVWFLFTGQVDSSFSSDHIKR